MDKTALTSVPFLFRANRNLTEKTMYGIHLYIAIKLFLTYELISAAPRANGGEKKVGGWKKRGREGNLGFEKVEGVKLEKDGKKGGREKLEKRVGGEKGGKKVGGEKGVKLRLQRFLFDVGAGCNDK